MRKKGKKCPFCSKKMVLENNRYKCGKCGYSVFDSNANPAGNWGVNEYSTTSNSSVYQNVTNANMFDYDQDHTEPRRTVVGAPGIRINWCKVLGGIVGIALACVGIWKGHIVDDRETSYRTESISVTWDKEYEEEITEKSDFPQSEFFQQFVSVVFQKEYTEVTGEEYESITSLRLGDNKEVTYSINDGEEEVLYFEEYYSEDMTDLNCFPGLKKLDLSNSSCILSKGDFDSLENLEEIGTQESPSILTSLIPHVEKIRSIKIGDDLMIDSLEGIEEFTNLEELYIEAEGISSIEEVCSLEQLKVLVIADGERIHNFGPLAALKNLKTLSITSSELKNIEFISEMKQLEDVTICKSYIKDIACLREHKNTLKQLTLIENYEVTDYSVLDELTGLEEAAIEFTYDSILPSFAGMTNMQTLSVVGAEDIRFVGNAVNVTELTLADCNLENMEVLTGLNNLKALHINEAGTYTKNLSPLMKLTGLELLDISGTNIFGYVEELLSLPNLKEFYMDECVVAFDFNKITGNETIKTLSMKEVTLLDYGADYDEQKYYANGEGTQISISDYTEAFQKFPNVTELYLAGDEIDNIDFVKYLPLLEVLDISDNYVSSVAPLKELPNLKVLWCQDNDIMDVSELGSEVTVIAE